MFSMSSPPPFIEELKSIRRKLFKKHAEENWDDTNDECEYDENHPYFDEITLFELLLDLDTRNSSPEDKILTYKMLDEEVDFHEFQYNVYIDYLNIYQDWGYERTPQDINDYIMEDYLDRKRDPHGWAISGCMDPNDYLPYFKLEFRIPQQQVQKYNERVAKRRLQEEYDRYDNY
jgi:hypothetical protein